MHLDQQRARIFARIKNPDLLYTIEPDELREVLSPFFEFVEYLAFEFEVNAKGEIVGGKLLPVRKGRSR